MNSPILTPYARRQLLRMLVERIIARQPPAPVAVPPKQAQNPPT